LLFPLAGYSPDNAPINSVFDHALNSPYNQDSVVVAYTGERGDNSRGGYRGFSGADNTPFTVNGNYTAGEPDTDRQSRYLYYDGHPGYDYRAPEGTTILAPASGTARVVGGEYGTIRIQHADGIESVFLHCRRFLVQNGESVAAGQPIAEVGSVGAAGPHMHMEVQVDGVPVDPYGWEGSFADPYVRATNVRLWATIEIGGEQVCSPLCSDGFACVRGACVVRCEDDVQCEGEETCQEGECIPLCEGHLGACDDSDGGSEPSDAGSPGTNGDAGTSDAGGDGGGLNDVRGGNDATGAFDDIGNLGAGDGGELAIEVISDGNVGSTAPSTGGCGLIPAENVPTQRWLGSLLLIGILVRSRRRVRAE
jgi:hypothetical protein